VVDMPPLPGVTGLCFEEEQLFEPDEGSERGLVGRERLEPREEVCLDEEIVKDDAEGICVVRLERETS
jgi:hypothetical protein